MRLHLGPNLGFGYNFQGKQAPPWLGIAGCQQWLEADAGITTSGGNVTAWADLSGNGNNAISAGTPPVFNATGGPNSLPSVDFSGTQYLTHELSLTPGCTLVALFKSSGTGFAGLYLCGKTAGGQGTNIFARLNTTGHWGSYQNAEAPSSVATPATYKKCIAIFNAYNSIDFRTNGTVFDHVTSGVSAYGPEVHCLIGTGAVGSQGLSGSIVLLGGFNKALSVTEAQLVEVYISAKYGI